MLFIPKINLKITLIILVALTIGVLWVRPNVKQSILYLSLTPYAKEHDLTKIQTWTLAGYARTNGVRQITPMPDSQKPPITSDQQTGCGWASVDYNVVFIDFERPECLGLGNLIHEIAHIWGFQNNCFGHGDKFYDYNYELAIKIEQDLDLSNSILSKAVIERSKNYRTYEEDCI